MADDRRGQFTESVKKFWQPYSKYGLTSEDAQEIVRNAVGLIRLLQEWDRRESGKKQPGGG